MDKFLKADFVSRPEQDPVYKALIFIVLLTPVCLHGCIERYYPDKDQVRSGVLVIVGHLESKAGKQRIQISQSASIGNSTYQPLSGYYVEVERLDGEFRVFDEDEAGSYQAYLDEEFLLTGHDYRLKVLSPEGRSYESSFERMFPAPVIDTVWFELEELMDRDTELKDQGIRFFIDFEIDQDSGRYLRWELEETFEIHNPDYETRMFGTDRRFHEVTGSMKTLDCWITRDIPGIYTQDLGNMMGEHYHRFRLNYVSGSTWRLLHRYSLLVRQYSLGDKAFWYWDELSKNLSTQGNLFDRQPALTPSNICNPDDPEERVIGYFSVSGVCEKRIFVEQVPGLEVFQDPFYCAPLSPPPMFLHYYPIEELPIYIARGYVLGHYEEGRVDEKCLDCSLYKGSTDEKPSYW